MLNLRVTLGIVFCIVFASAAPGANRRQTQKEPLSASLPLYEVVDLEIENAYPNAHPMDINNNGEVLIHLTFLPRARRVCAVWKNGKITRELPVLPSGPHLYSDYFRINDKGDVYGFVRSSEHLEPEELLATVVKITRNGRRFDWSVPEAQLRLVDLGLYSHEQFVHGEPYVDYDTTFKFDEPLEQLVGRLERVSAYLNGDRSLIQHGHGHRRRTTRQDTIDEYIFHRDKEGVIKGFIKGTLEPLLITEEDGSSFKVDRQGSSSIIDLNDQGLILGIYRELSAHSYEDGREEGREDTAYFLYHDGEMELLQNLLSNETEINIIEAFQINNAGDVLVLASGYNLDFNNYLFRPVIESPGPVYPQYTIYYPPTVPEVIIWGTGIPGPDSGDWSKLLPQGVIDEQQLDGRWIILAVHGQHLLDTELDMPELKWAGGDKHLDYKLLHSGRYSMEKVNGIDDPKWLNFWRALHLREAIKPGLRMEHSDVYIVAVHLAPNTWAGPYGFKLGDLQVNWTLPHATNIAETRFIRTLGIGRMVPGWVGAVAVETGPNGKKMLYERVDALFKYDRFYVEIETTGDVVTSDRIPFDLYSSKAGGASTRIDFPSHPLYAVLVDASPFFPRAPGANRRVFRSPLIRINNPRAIPGTSVVEGRPVYWVPLDPGDRLAARVMPHDVARQGRLAVAKVYSTPDKVGAFWRSVVFEAARIAKIETKRPIEQLSPLDLYNEVLLKPWKTVNSTPIVVIGGREIELKVEHLAVMLLIRKQFIASMEEALPRMQQMREKVKANPPKWARAVWAMLKTDAEREGTPLGDLPVLDWDPARHTTIMGQTVPYRNAYDEQWLEKTFRGFWGNRVKWQNEMAVFVFNGYVGAAEKALTYAQNMDMTDPDAEALLRLTTLGMRPMIDRVRPNMLRLVEDPSNIGINFRWEYERQARQSVALIEKLGDEFLKNEARVDEINDATALAAALIAIFLPETLVGQIVAAGLGIGSAAITLTRELPEFIGREADVRFALGAYLVIGEERYFTANLRRKSGWGLALDLAGANLDVGASILQLRHARSMWVAMRPDAEVASAFAKGAHVFVELPPKAQKSALLRLAQLSEMQASGKTLTGFETTIIERGTKMLKEIQTLGNVRPLRYVEPEVLTELNTIIMRDGSTGFVLEHRLAVAGGSDTVGHAATDAAAAFLAPPPPLRIPEQNPWHIFDVNERIGWGGYAQVYEIPLDSRLKALCKQLGIDASGSNCALKVYEVADGGIDDVKRALRTQEILEKAGIPQLKIIDSGQHGDMAYIVQEFMPAPGLYKPVSGTMMDKGMQKALLELHVKLAKADIGYLDGWHANLYFEELANGRFICGILDQDRVWIYGKGLTSAWEPKMLGRTIDIFRIPMGDGILSLAECRYTPRAQLLLEMGYCPWPKGDFLMMKMLEHRGWIRFDTDARKFVSDHLDIKLVEDYFPRLNHLDSIDTNFRVPEHLRHLAPDLPPSNLPDGGQSFNTLPFPEIMPWITALRIAA